MTEIKLIKSKIKALRYDIEKGFFSIDDKINKSNQIIALYKLLSTYKKTNILSKIKAFLQYINK